MTFPKEESENYAALKQSGKSLAKTFDTSNDTPALNAPKALCGAPISMGRGEKPVEL